MVHLYGRFLRSTSNSKPAVNTVSQLRLLNVDISLHHFLSLKMNIHVDTTNSMVQVNHSN